MASLRLIGLALAVAFFAGMLAPAVVLATTAFAPTFANDTFGTAGIAIAAVVFAAAIAAIVAYGDHLRMVLARSVADS
jgi:hypothetical protein